MTLSQPRMRRVRAPRLPHRLGLDEALRAGFALLEAGRLAEARHLFEQVRLSAPHHPTALVMLAVIAFRVGEDALAEVYLEEALAVYRDQLRQAPGAPGLLAPLVNLLLAKGREEEAERLARTLELDLNPIRCEPGDFLAAWRRARARGLPTLLLVTLPKSASETIWNRLAAGLGLPTTHLSLGLFPHCCLLPSRLRRAAVGGLSAKEHILPSTHNLESLREVGLTRLLVHLRDPRQAVLSWAHFVSGDVAHRRMGAVWRSTVPPRAVLERGFPAVLDWCIDRVLPLYVRFAEAWVARADKADSPWRVRILTFERFLREPTAYMEEVLEHFAIDPALFDSEAAAAAASFHQRRGRPDEWREVFTRAQKARARRILPAELCERFGWPRSSPSWRSAHVVPSR